MDPDQIDSASEIYYSKGGFCLFDFVNILLNTLISARLMALALRFEEIDDAVNRNADQSFELSYVVRG